MKPMRTLRNLRTADRRPKLPLLFAVVAFLMLSCFALSGQAATRRSKLTAMSYQQSSASSNEVSLSQQLVKETREAAGEDDASQFKHSPAVRLIAKLTGLNLEHAYWVCVLLNFVVIAAAIFWLSKKNLPGLFRNRTASIQKAMEEARKASQEANRRLAEIEARLSKLDVEMGGMRAAAEKEAAAEEQRIKTAAAEDARKIVESAEQEIAAEDLAAMDRHGGLNVEGHRISDFKLQNSDLLTTNNRSVSSCSSRDRPRHCRSRSRRR